MQNAFPDVGCATHHLVHCRHCLIRTPVNQNYAEGCGKLEKSSSTVGRTILRLIDRPWVYLLKSAAKFRTN